MDLERVRREDSVSHQAWHSFKNLTWLWHNIIGLCSDVSVSRQEHGAKGPGCLFGPAAVTLL